jgi:hypothetical protein
MPSNMTLAEQALYVESRAQIGVRKRVTNWQTFNSRRMWLLVVFVWTLAAGILVLGLAKPG